VLVSSRVIPLRRDDVCIECKRFLPASTRARWDPGTRTTTCLDCVATDRVLHVDSAAGASSQREYDKRHRRWEERQERRWGWFSPVAKAVLNEPRSTRAWGKGAAGERRLATSLAERLGERAVLLHDRRVPGTRSNIDHLAIAATGVWVIDAKTYTGQVQRRDKGGWFTTDHRLFVHGRDKTALIDGLGWQVEAVERALGGLPVPITPVLCFVGAEWGWFPKPFQLRGVWVTWGAKLAEMIAAPGPVADADVTDIADRLQAALLSA
jgi:hypothetical protein